MPETAADYPKIRLQPDPYDPTDYDHYPGQVIQTLGQPGFSPIYDIPFLGSLPWQLQYRYFDGQRVVSQVLATRENPQGFTVSFDIFTYLSNPSNPNSTIGNIRGTITLPQHALGYSFPSLLTLFCPQVAYHDSPDKVTYLFDVTFGQSPPLLIGPSPPPPPPPPPAVLASAMATLDASRRPCIAYTPYVLGVSGSPPPPSAVKLLTTPDAGHTFSINTVATGTVNHSCLLVSRRSNLHRLAWDDGGSILTATAVGSGEQVGDWGAASVPMCSLPVGRLGSSTMMPAAKVTGTHPYLAQSSFNGLDSVLLSYQPAYVGDGSFGGIGARGIYVLESTDNCKSWTLLSQPLLTANAGAFGRPVMATDVTSLGPNATRVVAFVYGFAQTVYCLVSVNGGRAEFGVGWSPGVVALQFPLGFATVKEVAACVWQGVIYVAAKWVGNNTFVGFTASYDQGKTFKGLPNVPVSGAGDSAGTSADPFSLTASPHTGRLYFSTFLHSDDGGKTWNYN